jgi:hypothetical protein
MDPLSHKTEADMAITRRSLSSAIVGSVIIGGATKLRAHQKQNDQVDCGVVYFDSGRRLTRVTGNPSRGEYFFQTEPTGSTPQLKRANGFFSRVHTYETARYLLHPYDAGIKLTFAISRQAVITDIIVVPNADCIRIEGILGLYGIHRDIPLEMLSAHADVGQPEDIINLTKYHLAAKLQDAAGRKLAGKGPLVVFAPFQIEQFLTREERDRVDMSSLSFVRIECTC